MDYSVQRLQFLDLTDANENDQSLIEHVLFSSDQALEVPWYTKRSTECGTEAGHKWGITFGESQGELQINNQVENVANVGEQCETEIDQDNGSQEEARPQQEHVPRHGNIFGGHPPTSLPHQPQIYQVVPSLSNVYVSNVTANVNVHGPYVPPIPTSYGHRIPAQQQQPPQHLYSHALSEESDPSNRNRRRQKSDKKRDGSFVQNNEVLSPALDGHPPQYPSIHPIPPYYIPGAPGAPVYMSHAVLPVYPSPMFSPYSHSPGPIVYPQANNIDAEPEEYNDNTQNNYQQGAAEIVVVGCSIRSENPTDHNRGAQDDRNFQTEVQHGVVIEDPSTNYKQSLNNFNFQVDDGESETNHSFPHQNGSQFEETRIVEPVVIVNDNYLQKEQSQQVDKNLDSKQIISESKVQADKTREGDSTGFRSENTTKLSPIKKKTGSGLNVNNMDKVSVNNNSKDGVWAGADERASTAEPETIKIKVNSSASVHVVKVDDTSVLPLQQNNISPVIDQNMDSNQNLRLNSIPVQPGSTFNNNTPSGGKSWASLFNSTSDTRGRPLARVPPYHEGESVNAIQPHPVLVSTPLTSSTGKVGGKASAKSNELLINSNSNFDSDPYIHNLGVFLNTYELEHKIISLQPRGLTNRSNWCYVNAVLQSLIACPPFYNFLKALPINVRKKGNKQTLIMDAMVNFANEFNPMPTNARIGKREKSARNKEENGVVEVATGPSFEPSGIYKILDKVRGGGSFNIEGRQEDAEEFLSCLLNGLNDEMFEIMKMAGPNKSTLLNGDANGASENSIDDDDTEWNVMGPKNKSSVTRRAVCGKTPVSDIFRGQIRSRVQRAGDHSTDTVQPFFTLQLDIEKANSVKDALELFMGKDPLEGVTCSRTHQEVEAWTQTTLEDLPLVLILHLKCYDYKSDACSKIIKSFDFQVDLKIDGKLLANRNKYTGKQRNYKLVAVVYHDGKEASKGHYVTDAYHVGYGCWLRYDDVVVRSVPELHVLKPRAPRVPYLLYYRRADTIGSAK